MRWRILALLFLARIGLGLQFQTLGSVGDDLSRQFGLSYAEVGVLIGLFMAPGLFLALPAGFAGRYLPDRLLSGFGLAAMAVGGALCAVAPDSELIGVGRTVAGVGFLFSTLYLTKMIADWFAGREIATAMSIFVMSWPLGIAMGQVGYEWLAIELGWRMAFAAASSYCALAALALLTLYRTPELARPAGGSASTWLSARELGLTLWAALAWAVFNAGYVAYLTFGPLVLEAQGASAFDAATIISVGSWVMIASGAVCGLIADRTGRPDLVIAICILGAVASLGLLAVEGAGLWASLMFGLIGVAPAGVIMALAGEAMRPESRAFGMGVFLTVYYAAMAAGPPLGGWIFDQTGRPFDAILLGATLFAAVLPALFAFRTLQRRGAVSSPARSPAPSR